MEIQSGLPQTIASNRSAALLDPPHLDEKLDGSRSRANTWLKVWSPAQPSLTKMMAVCVNTLIKNNPLFWMRLGFEDHCLPLTDHLSQHEDQADHAGNEKLPSGQTSGVAVDLRHWSSHLAELLMLPQANQAGHIFAPLGRRVWTFLLWGSLPKLWEKHHNWPRFLEDFIKAFKLTSLKCRDDLQSGVLSLTLLKTPFVSPTQFHSWARESCHLL